MSLLAGWTLATPAWLLLLALLPVISWVRGLRGRTVLAVPFVSRWAVGATLSRSRLPLVLVNLGLVLLAVALARPQRLDATQQVRQDGYDIVLAIDLSGSMLAEDYAKGEARINRLQAVKPIVEAFLARRPNDRIGVVAFGGRAYTLAPLTSDHEWLRAQVGRLQVGLIEDGTAIGDGVTLSVSRLAQRERQADGKRLGGFVILLTDGANNAGVSSPAQAAELAKAKGIPVYTIGAGQSGPVPMPVFTEDGRKVGYRTVLSDLDEQSLVELARITGGQYFRAMDADTVEAAFAAIDRERPIQFDATSRERAHELFPYVAWPALALCLLGFWLAQPSRRETYA
jgi:Ca-activated chloride channel family protein